MKEPIDYLTVQVKESSVVTTADQRVAILLRMPSGRAIAFEVSPEAIATLRRHLLEAEVLLSQRPGQA